MSCRTAASTPPAPCPSHPRHHTHTSTIFEPRHIPSPCPTSTQLHRPGQDPSLHHAGCSWHPDEIRVTGHVPSPLSWPCFPATWCQAALRPLAGQDSHLQLHSLLRQVLGWWAAENSPLAGLLQLPQPCGQTPQTTQPVAGTCLSLPGQPMPLRGTTHQVTQPKQSPVAPSWLPPAFTGDCSHQTDASSHKAGATEPWAAPGQRCPCGASCPVAIPQPPGLAWPALPWGTNAWCRPVAPHAGITVSQYWGEGCHGSAAPVSTPLQGQASWTCSSLLSSHRSAGTHSSRAAQQSHLPGREEGLRALLEHSSPSRAHGIRPLARFTGNESINTPNTSV